MRTQGQPRGEIILKHPLARGKRRQDGPEIGQSLTIHLKQWERPVAPQPFHVPNRITARQSIFSEGIGTRQFHQGRSAQTRTPPDRINRMIAIAPCGGEPVAVIFPESPDLPEAEPDGEGFIMIILQYIVPIAVLGADWIDGHAMPDGIAHDLGRRVKAQRLCVQQRAAKDFRMVAFNPGRSVNKQGKTRRMAFGESHSLKSLPVV